MTACLLSFLLALGELAKAQTVLDFHYPNPLPMPGECIPRERFPEALQVIVPKADGRSGLQLGANQDGECFRLAYCVEFSQTEFEKLFGRKYEGFVESTKVPVAACKTSEDFSSESKKAEATTRQLSEYGRDPRIKTAMENMVGEWCGRIEKPWMDGRQLMEIRVRFTEDQGMIVGRPVETWNRTPRGPLGETGYVSEFELVPWRYSDPAGVQLRGVHSTQSGDYWYVFPSAHGAQLDNGQWKFALSRDCSGYWKPD